MMPTSNPLRNEKARDDSSRDPRDDLRLSPNDRVESRIETAMRVADADAKATTMTMTDDDEASDAEDDKVCNDCGLEHRTPERPDDARQQEGDA